MNKFVNYTQIYIFLWSDQRRSINKGVAALYFIVFTIFYKNNLMFVKLQINFKRSISFVGTLIIPNCPKLDLFVTN